MRGDLLAGGRMGIALPKQPLKKAELHCECPGMSIYSEVRKGTSKASCQDSTIVLADGGYVLLGLFDGYGNLGGRVPYLLGKELDALWDGEKEEMNKYRL
ncbi:TPA: hypothetical protein EYP38_04380, partial [Candidatus Micrarchaeota archaeon]|nr:hypothetical protein [Candidatus Micrarchaeota archaeon]